MKYIINGLLAYLTARLARLNSMSDRQPKRLNQFNKILGKRIG